LKQFSKKCASGLFFRAAHCRLNISKCNARLH